MRPNPQFPADWSHLLKKSLMEKFNFCTELVVHGPVANVRPFHFECEAFVKSYLPKHSGFIVETNYIVRLLTNALNNVKYLPISDHCSHLYPLKPLENLSISGFCRGYKMRALAEVGCEVLMNLVTNDMVT